MGEKVTIMILKVDLQCPCCYKPAMDFLQEIQTTNVNEMEYGYEDDVFYSELRKQVLQLTAEDEDEEYEERVYGNKNSIVAAAAQKQRGYYDWPPNKEEIAAPAWTMNLWRTGNGTGVFIPQIVQQSKKKSRSRRRRNESGRTYKRVERN